MSCVCTEKERSGPRRGGDHQEPKEERGNNEEQCVGERNQTNAHHSFFKQRQYQTHKNKNRVQTHQHCSPAFFPLRVGEPIGDTNHMGTSLGP
jgi:hypothetical protein